MYHQLRIHGIIMKCYRKREEHVVQSSPTHTGRMYYYVGGRALQHAAQQQILQLKKSRRNNNNNQKQQINEENGVHTCFFKSCQSRRLGSFFTRTYSTDGLNTEKTNSAKENHGTEDVTPHTDTDTHIHTHKSRKTKPKQENVRARTNTNNMEYPTHGRSKYRATSQFVVHVCLLPEHNIHSISIHDEGD
jgi:hypothetical protein